MANYLIGYGGTGQHVALSYARLCFLCKDIVDKLDSPGQGHLPFFYIFDKDVGAKEGDAKTAATLLFDFVSRLYSTSEIKPVSPIPVVDPEDQIETLRDLLKSNPELAQLLFTNHQLGVRVVHGNFGQPAVGATGLYLKMHDMVQKDDRQVNKDTTFADLRSNIETIGNQKIAHVGSAIGGTGSGVMPAAVSLFYMLNSKNTHFSIPVLEWFKLKGAGETAENAANRNNLIRQNRSSGLHFYLKNLQSISSVVPLGYSRNRLERYESERLWEGDFNQTVKESAINLAAALAIWEFYFSKQVYQNGIYLYATDEAQNISHLSKLGGYTLGSVLSANLKLIAGVEQVCNFLKNPPVTDYVLFKNLREKLTFPVLRKYHKSKWAKFAEELQALLNNRIEAVNWLKSLDFVDNSVKSAKVTASFKGIKQFSDLFPKDIGEGNLVKALYEHIVNRAKSNLIKFEEKPGDETLTSTQRLLPDYVMEGVNPPPAPVGTIKEINDTNYIRRLYRTAEITPESIPSPFGAIHSINLEIDERLAKIDNPAMDNDTIQEEHDELMQSNAQRRKLLFDRYLLLFKGLIAGKVVPKKQLLWEEKENRSDKKSIGWVLGHLRSGEDQRYSDLPEPYIYYLTFTTDKNREAIMGATTPTIFLFPSMSAGEDIWDALDKSVKFIGNDVLSALAQWCDYIKQRDGLNDHERPRWFRILWQEVAKYSGMQRSREIEAPEDTFPVFWGEKFINIPMLRLKEEV